MPQRTEIPATDITLIVAQSPRYFPHVERHLWSLRKVHSSVALLYWEKDFREPLYESPGVRVTRVILPFGSGGPAFFLRLMAGFLRRLLRDRPGSIEAIDPYALVPARCYASLRGLSGKGSVRIAYFSMEYFRALPALEGKPWKRRIWEGLERWGAGEAASVAAVCDGIAARLRADFRRDRVVTVRNVPYLSDREDTGTLHERCGIPRNAPVAIYQGMLQTGRGLEASIDAVASIPGLHLALAGDGPLREALQSRAAAAGCAHRVHLLGEVDFRDLAGLTPGAFAGLVPIQPLSLSYTLSLPGKLFEYIQAGVPVIATALPEIRKIVEGYGVGICIEPFGSGSLAEALSRMREDGALRHSLLENLARAKAELCWEKEEEIYLSLYR